MKEPPEASLLHWVDRYAQATWLPPFPQALPSNAAGYAASVSSWKVARRRALREINLAFHGQGSLTRSCIDPSIHRRILWIHQGMPQVGDSLMDLAGRVLLKGRVERLDLLTDAHLVSLYRHDEVFTQVVSSAAELREPYDLVLLHSASSRSLKDKQAHFRRVPFVHVQGFFTGPEFNRTLFGYYRLAQLLGLNLSEQEIDRMACPSMHPAAAEVKAAQALGLPPDAIVMAIGGVQGGRTYLQWPAVLHGMHQAGITRPVVLVGSDNGMAMRDEIKAAETGMLIIDRVAQHTLGEVHALMQCCALVVCADSGLLHVAHAAQVPVVTLFAGVIEPAFRLTSANRTRWLYDPGVVNDIRATDVVSMVTAALSSADTSLGRPASHDPR